MTSPCSCDFDIIMSYNNNNDSRLTVVRLTYVYSACFLDTRYK